MNKPPFQFHNRDTEHIEDHFKRLAAEFVAWVNAPDFTSANRRAMGLSPCAICGYPHDTESHRPCENCGDSGYLSTMDGATIGPCDCPAGGA